MLQRVRSAVTTWPTRARVMSRASAMSDWLGQWLGGWDSDRRDPEQGGADAPFGVLLGDLDPDDPVLQEFEAGRSRGLVGGRLFLGRAASTLGNRPRSWLRKSMISRRV